MRSGVVVRTSRYLAVTVHDQISRLVFAYDPLPPSFSPSGWARQPQDDQILDHSDGAPIGVPRDRKDPSYRLHAGKPPRADLERMSFPPHNRKIGRLQLVSGEVDLGLPPT